MKTAGAKWKPLFTAAAAVAMFAAYLCGAELLEKSKKMAGLTVRYK